MEIINQTNRTLLLDVINPDKMDLLTLVGDVKGQDSLSDDKMREINQHLECHSYEEMERKFEPLVGLFTMQIHSPLSIRWSGRRIFRNRC